MDRSEIREKREELEAQLAQTDHDKTDLDKKLLDLQSICSHQEVVTSRLSRMLPHCVCTDCGMSLPVFVSD